MINRIVLACLFVCSTASAQDNSYNSYEALIDSNAVVCNSLPLIQLFFKAAEEDDTAFLEYVDKDMKCAVTKQGSIVTVTDSSGPYRKFEAMHGETVYTFWTHRAYVRKAHDE